MNDSPDQGRPLTIDTLEMLANQLDEVIEEIEAWGISIHPASRLPRIVDILRETASAGRYPVVGAALLRIGMAIQVAQEFVEVGNTLPNDPIESMATDLQIALGGALEWRPTKKTHLQRQTQLWVGAMMVQAGAPTGILQRPQGKNPDFELENGTKRYAVEVKRPETENWASSLVSGAAEQIRSGRYHGGSIVVDFTDCIDEATVLQIAKGEPDLGPLNERLVDLASALHRNIFDDSVSLLRIRRDHIFSLVAFARYVYWNEEDVAVPYLGRAVMTIEYQKGGAKTLKAHRAKWLGGLVHEGITGSGHRMMGELDVRRLL